jgi:UDP-4-amino-4,6-dideoxy-N-acetyl-beta-L-altrosamine transaminase
LIPYGRQSITERDIESVTEALRSSWLTQGPTVPRFEEAVAARCQNGHAVAVNSGTSALHLVCSALGLGPGDRLWTTPITFVASANCGLYCGAQVDFVDVDPATTNLDVGALETKLLEAEKTGSVPKVVVAVDFAGQPSDLAELRALADRFGFFLVEDACHALGAQYRDAPAASGTYAHASVLSFHPVKIITTGEGGMALTPDPELAERMALLRTHGITRDPSRMEEEPHGPWYYEQVALGWNYRMTDLQAALGLSQLERLDAFLERRRTIAARYNELLRDLPVTPLTQKPDRGSAWHLYVVRLDLEALRPKTRRDVFEALRAAGIGVQVHYIPVHLQPWYRKMGFRKGMYPAAERYYEEAITLPLYPELTEAEQDRVIAALQEALR